MAYSSTSSRDPHGIVSLLKMGCSRDRKILVLDIIQGKQIKSVVHSRDRLFRCGCWIARLDWRWLRVGLGTFVDIVGDFLPFVSPG
jgi:hypothetical protein